MTEHFYYINEKTVISQNKNFQKLFSFETFNSLKAVADWIVGGQNVLLLVDIVVLISLGFLVGLIASMTGVGDGTFNVPALWIIYVFTSQEAS